MLVLLRQFEERTFYNSERPGVGCTCELVAPLSTSMIWKRLLLSIVVYKGLSSKNFCRFSKDIITMVKLSRERSIAACLIIVSAI